MLRITSLTLLLAACAIETGDEESTTTQAAAGCPTWGCGENSPTMGPFDDWWELHNPQPGSGIGLPNSADIQVIDFQIGMAHYRPEIVNGDELRAVHASGTIVTGVGLQGGYFNVLTPGGIYKIIITKVNAKAASNVTFWVGPAGDQIETYELFWTGPGGAGRVCENAPGRSSGEQGGHFWLRPLEAIFFTGDRYDADHKRVTHSDYASTTGWFNIGCAGSVLAKLHLNRHTTAGSTAGWNTTADARQTLLKMYVSDVCGGGEAWTTPGTPLNFEQTTGWMQLTGAEFDIESQWGPGGALCLDYHRKGSQYTSLLNAPNIIQSSCPRGMLPPPCAQKPSDFSGASPFLPGAYIVSAVPAWVP